MVEPNRIPSVGGTQTPDTRATQQPQTSGGGPAFRALLDKLEQQTQGLRAASEGLEDPAELAGAVDQARATLTDAQSLGEQLLEAYRASQQRAENPESSTGENR